ncbi:MAG: hypothetical protein JXQ27_01510, partial [Acidobacteria bacterium]|nr:hypothetical protein [Acidobacteriota bacterium]
MPKVISTLQFKAEGIILYRAVLLALFFLLAGCAADRDRAGNISAAERRILFVGNSYTSFHNLPEMVRALAAAMVPPVYIQADMITAGGASLADHRAAGTVSQALHRQSYDYMILQEQSCLGSTLHINGRRRIREPDRFFANVRHLDGQAQQAGTRTMLFLTWASEYTPANQATLTWAYMEIGRELGCRVIPVGIAWQRARNYLDQTGRHCPLYLPDGAHPAPAGTYLAACMVVTALTGRTPLGLPGALSVRQVDPEVSAFGLPGAGSEVPLQLGEPETAPIQRAVWETYQELAQTSGYATVKPVPPPAVPSLPNGIPWHGRELRGVWTGELLLFPGFDHTRLTLILFGDNDLTAVELQLAFDPPVQAGIRHRLNEIRRHGDELSFTDPAGPADTRIIYRGVFTGQTLRGTAEARKGDD